MYPAPAPRPATGGTAVTAAILALLGGLAAFGGVVMYVANTLRFDSPWFGWGIVPGWTSIVTVLLLVIDVIAGVMLLAGAALILRRRKAGPVLVILGCLGEIGSFVLGGVSTVLQLMDYGIPLSRQLDAVLGNSSINLILGADVDIPWAVSLLMLVFPVLTFVLAVLPSTRRWCRSGPPGFGGPGMQPFPMQQPGMPQGGGYGAPQGQWPRPQDGYRPR